MHESSRNRQLLQRKIHRSIWVILIGVIISIIHKRQTHIKGQDGGIIRWKLWVGLGSGSEVKAEHIISIIKFWLERRGRLLQYVRLFVGFEGLPICEETSVVRNGAVHNQQDPKESDRENIGVYQLAQGWNLKAIKNKQFQLNTNIVFNLKQQELIKTQNQKR